MLDIKELSKYLSISNINRAIIEQNKEDLALSLKLLNFTENNMFTKINSTPEYSEEDELINTVIILLFVQGIKSYKSSLLLCLNGYYTTSIIVARNLIETIFNIMYIFESPEESTNRANDYLNNVSKWTDETIKNRAYLSYNSTLYNLYRLTSDYTHSNFIATSQNFDKDNVLSPFPSAQKINEAIVLINSIYYYLIEFLCQYYWVDFKEIEKTKKTKAFNKRYKTYKMFNFSHRYYD